MATPLNWMDWLASQGINDENQRFNPDPALWGQYNNYIVNAVPASAWQSPPRTVTINGKSYPIGQDVMGTDSETGEPNKFQDYVTVNGTPYWRTSGGLQGTIQDASGNSWAPSEEAIKAAKASNTGFWNGPGPALLGIGAFALPTLLSAMGGAGVSGAAAGGSQSALPAAITSAADPIEAMYQLDLATGGGMTANQAAQAYGFGSFTDLAKAINPAWVGSAGWGLSDLAKVPTSAVKAATGAATGSGGGMNDISSIISSLIPAAAAYLASGGGGSDAAGQASNAANILAGISADQWNYYKQHYQPLETNLIAQAQSAGSPEEYARAAGEANANVTGAFDQARKQTESRLQATGINPGAPAYQAAMGSTDLAQGAAAAGAQTTAANNVRNLAYQKALDVVGIGRNLPATAGSAATNAANTAATGARLNAAQQTARGQAIAPLATALGQVATPFLTNAAKNWFGTSGSTSALGTTPSYESFNVSTPTDSYWPDTGSETFTFGYARGGLVGNEEPDAQKRMRLKMLLMKKGLSDEEADRQSRIALTRYAKGGLGSPITPHMKTLRPKSMDMAGYADGGGVGRQGMAMPDASNMGEMMGPGTETSDSIPAVIDGQQPAALSTGEMVMNAQVPEMSGKEILDALNQAGLRRRGIGLEASSASVPNDAGTLAYRRGGMVGYCRGGLVGR